MRKSSRVLSEILFVLTICHGAFAQEISVELGKEEVGLNELFTITITIQNGSIKSYTDFPEIDGFSKRGTSSSSKTNIVNGQISSSQSVIQRYLPLEEGSYTLAPFSIEVNGESVSSNGKEIKIIPPVEHQQTQDEEGMTPFLLTLLMTSLGEKEVRNSWM